MVLFFVIAVMMRTTAFIFLVLGMSLQLNAQKKCYDLGTILAVVPSPVYAKHLEASKKFNIKVLKDDKTIKKYRSNGKLSPVKKLGKGYRISKLDHSHALLVPKAEVMLLEIAKKFSSKTKGSTLTFTSLTRTLEDQCNLRKVNPNASIGLSSHNYGNSFDISYVRFNDRLGRNERLERILDGLLKEYEKAGKIYYIKERKQSCFHVTVR